MSNTSILRTALLAVSDSRVEAAVAVDEFIATGETEQLGWLSVAAQRLCIALEAHDSDAALDSASKLNIDDDAKMQLIKALQTDSLGLEWFTKERGGALVTGTGGEFTEEQTAQFLETVQVEAPDVTVQVEAPDVTVPDVTAAEDTKIVIGVDVAVPGDDSAVVVEVNAPADVTETEVTATDVTVTEVTATDVTVTEVTVPDAAATDATPAEVTPAEVTPADDNQGKRRRKA